jgi:hypothetical protein
MYIGKKKEEDTEKKVGRKFHILINSGGEAIK